MLNAEKQSAVMLSSASVTCIDLSTIGIKNPEAELEDEASVSTVWRNLRVGHVEVKNCPDFQGGFAIKGENKLQRLKQYFGDTEFPVIVLFPFQYMDACNAEYRTVQHKMRTEYLRRRLGVEKAVVALHLTAGNTFLHLKEYFEKIVRVDFRQQTWRWHVATMHQQLFSCESVTPLPRRSLATASFVMAVSRSVLETVMCNVGDDILTIAVMESAWKTAQLPDDVACKLLSVSGLRIIKRMSRKDFIQLFNSYTAVHRDRSNAAEDRRAIATFEKDLLGDPFDHLGIATGGTCTAFDFFAASLTFESAARETTIKEDWDALSHEVQGEYEVVAEGIKPGQTIDELKRLLSDQHDKSEQIRTEAAALAAAAAAAAAASQVCTCYPFTLLSCVLGLHLLICVLLLAHVACSCSGCLRS